MRLRSLRDLRKFKDGHKNLKAVLSMTSVELRKLEEHHFPSATHTSRLAIMSHEEIQRQGDAAQKWLLDMLDCQDRVMTREYGLRMFRLAVEKQMNGRQHDWTHKERLFMALTDLNLASPEERLRAAFTVVLHLNYAESQQDVSQAIPKLTERLKHACELDAELFETREDIFERTQSISVDHFACAIPLSLLTVRANNASVVDDNAGCCPICQNSYTSLKDFSIEELLADYPVRIKHCGHIVGKACLERWMRTPKIDEAKYPHRTCPLCRVKIEGVEPPAVPRGLLKHYTTNRRALETVRELVYGYDMDRQDCNSAISACMSEEIACEELMSQVKRNDSGERDDRILKDKLLSLRKEKWAWGFRGDGVWAKLKDEWMNSGVM
jgi:hypothetical protein